MSLFAPLRVTARCHWQALAMVSLCAFTGPLQAQSAVDDDSADPPARVARLSYIAGDLGLLPAGATDWSDAGINRPLTTGDRLSAGQNARAELEFDGGTLRMDNQTELGLLDLTDQLAQIELTQGTLNLTVRRLDDGQSYEIDTPTVALVVDQPGSFRVDIEGDATRVTALDGNATVYGEDNAQRAISRGRSYRFADSGLAQVAVEDAGGGDGFDRWSDERESRYAQSTTRQYVSEDMVGYQDLDQYGDWQQDDEYGAMWFPNRVDASWAPYRDGRWAYVAPWGWTWVDDSPWGFAPYHYGRWAHVRGGWGWIPGQRGPRAVYAPALVAFVGGAGWAAGNRPVGWFPLGPGDIYNPWYRCGRACYTNLNLRSMRGRHGDDPRRAIDDHYNRYRRGGPSSDEHYANRYAPHGITAMGGAAFASGGRVQHNLLRVDAHRFASAPVMSRGASDVRPAAGAARPSRAGPTRIYPTAGFRRDVVARHAPATGTPARNMADLSQAGGQRSHVRVLGQSDGFRRDRPADQADRRARRGLADGDLRQSPRAAAPAVPQEMNTRSSSGDASDAQPRSSRFAHADNRADVRDRRESMPRPGQRDGADADAGDYRSRQNDRRFPAAQTPSFQRNATPERSMPSAVEQSQRYDASRMPRNGEREYGMGMRDGSEPRVDRAERIPRGDNRPPPVRTMASPPPARQSFQQPRYEQPPRAAPAPRHDTPRPERGESRYSQKYPSHERAAREQH